MVRVRQALELVKHDDIQSFTKGIPLLQRTVEDLCKLGFASKIIDET
jgi:hypothetical protein